MKPEHALFVNEYVCNGGNGTQAYMSAYPSAKYDSASVLANKLIRNIKIQEAIQAEFARIFKDKDKEFKRGELYQQISQIGNSDISDIIEIEGDTLRIKDLNSLPPSVRKCIKTIKVSRKDTEQGEQVVHEVTLHDKMKALELQAKILRLVNDDPIEIDVVIKRAVRPDKPRPRRDIVPEYEVEADKQME